MPKRGARSLERKAQDLFQSNEFIGSVLRWSCFLEFHLDFALASYFGAEGRSEALMEHVFSQMSFHSKIEVLASLPLSRRLRSHVNSVAALRRFKKIRNMVAHQAVTPMSDVLKLLSDGQIKQMLLGYPKEMHREFYLTRQRLWQLEKSRSFAGRSRSSR